MNKIKLLAVGDDIRGFSGMGRQLRKVLCGLLATGRYDIAGVACTNHPKSMDMAVFEGIRLYPAKEHGTMDDFRRIIAAEHPQIVLALGDPRTLTQLFMMDNEIRSTAKFLLWHVWDNGPYPKFNAPLYACCDRIITFSNFSHKLLEDGGTPNDCIPCSVDPKEFYPLPESVIQSGRRELFATANGREINFLAFWNNRNGNRKRLIDTLTAFKEFSKVHPDSMLFVNTDARDLEGVDVMTVVDELEGTDSPIVFNFKRMPAEQLNVLYNIADVTINISYWEGFGLSIAESLACGTPVICTRTGGMPEQAETERGPAGIILDPLARFMFGTIEVPYIYQDFVSVEQVVEALNISYENSRRGLARGWEDSTGERGRQHILKHFHSDDMIRKFDELFTEEAAKAITFRVWRTLKI
jgi:glycosyltransferase involved in cell wall biosynthesis